MIHTHNTALHSYNVPDRSTWAQTKKNCPRYTGSGETCRLQYKLTLKNGLLSNTSIRVGTTTRDDALSVSHGYHYLIHLHITGPSKHILDNNT